MSDQLEVRYEALTECADGHVDAAGRARAVDGLRAAATLPAGSLGKLPQSDDIQAAFDEAWRGTGAALADLEQAFEGIADRLLQFRDRTAELDTAVGEGFDRLRGGR